MTRNKILGAAVAAALSLGGITAQASDFTLRSPTDNVGADVGTPADGTQTVPIELFNPTDDVVLPDNDNNTTAPSIWYIKKSFVLEVAADIEKPFSVTDTLSAGEWGSLLTSSNLMWAVLPCTVGTGGICQNIDSDANGTVDITDTWKAPNIALITSGGNPATATFNVLVGNDTAATSTSPPLVQGGGTTNNKYTLIFVFQVKGLNEELSILGDVTNTLTLSYLDGSGNVVDPENVTVLRSVTGTSIACNEGPDTNVKIDVAQGGTKFANSTATTTDPTTTAILGGITITNNTAKQYDLDTAWALNDANNGAKDDGTLVVTGPFNASVSHDKGTTELVYIDYNGGCDNVDISADTVDATTATWENITAAQLELIRAGTAVICVKVPDGNATVITEMKTPECLWTINYENRNGFNYGGKLRHIPPNGARCDVYNMPAAGANDIGNVRITNKSGRAGTLMGILRTKAGETIPVDGVPIDLLGGDPFNPKQTVKVSSNDLEGIFGTVPSGRYVFGVVSDLEDIEVFLLLRNQTVAGSPLLNMSLGGAGSGCQ